jgi:hypothetical protein
MAAGILEGHQVLKVICRILIAGMVGVACAALGVWLTGNDPFGGPYAWGIGMAFAAAQGAREWYASRKRQRVDHVPG